MSIRSRIGAAKGYGPLPPDAAQPVILNYSQPAPTVILLSQAIDSKPLFQIDYSPTLTITHVQTGERLGTVGFNSEHKLSLSQHTTNTNITYRDRIEPPTWFRATNGNKLSWETPAFNPYQATLHCTIVDGKNYDDEEDVAVAVILDSKWKKGRIEFRKAMGKDEMDFLLLSSVAEIEDLRGKIKEGHTYGGNALATSGAASSGGSTAAQAVGYLKVASAGANFVQAISGGGGGA